MNKITLGEKEMNRVLKEQEKAYLKRVREIKKGRKEQERKEKIENKVKNPLTGRYISKDGDLCKNLKKEGKL